jgi:hypothetical protein
MKHEYVKLLENKTAVTRKAVSTRTERITGQFCAPEMSGGLVSRSPGFKFGTLPPKPHRNHIIANIFFYWVLTTKDKFWYHEMPLGFMVYKVAPRQFSVGVFSFICVINSFTNFSHSIA